MFRTETTEVNKKKTLKNTVLFIFACNEVPQEHTRSTSGFSVFLKRKTLN